jgi:hypothetical protein
MQTGVVDRPDRRDVRPRRFMVVWQDPETRSFHQVGRLEFTEAHEFRFAYLPEARLVPRFRPFAAFPDLDHEYRSDDLFPFFANRVMSARRPDFDAHLTALGLTVAEMRRLTLWETGLLGASAGLLALPTGYVLAWILIFIINQRSFGWTLQMHVNPAPFVQAFLLAVSAALLAAIYPAWRISRMQAAEALRGE